LGVHLDRKQAMAMLKELVVNNLVEPTYVHICQKTFGNYQIQIRSDYNREGRIRKKHDLTIEEDKERKYLPIFKL
jgi:hypothetical protein